MVGWRPLRDVEDMCRGPVEPVYTAPLTADLDDCLASPDRRARPGCRHPADAGMYPSLSGCR